MQSLIEKLAAARTAYETSLAAYDACPVKHGGFYTNDERAMARTTALKCGQAYKHYRSMMHTCQQELNKAAFAATIMSICKLPALSIAIDMLSEQPAVTTPHADEDEAFGFV